MKKGGYQIIDLQNKNHEIGVGMVHEGIYDKIEGTRKALLISGLQVNDTEFHDTFSTPVVDGSNFVFAMYDGSTKKYFYMTVADTDVVTVTVE